MGERSCTSECTAGSSCAALTKRCSSTRDMVCDKALRHNTRCMCWNGEHNYLHALRLTD